MIVILDASAAVAIALNLPESARLQTHIETSNLVIAPDILVVEVSNALWKYVKAGVVNAEQGSLAIERAIGLVDSLVPGLELSIEAFSLAIDHLHPVCDALYVVLARRHNGTLATLDKRMAGLASKLHVKIAI